MGAIIHDDIIFSGGGTSGGTTEIPISVILTQAQYDALSQAEKEDLTKVYYISDASSSGGGYILPVATGTTLGGVKVKTRSEVNSSINNEDRIYIDANGVLKIGLPPFSFCDWGTRCQFKTPLTIVPGINYFDENRYSIAYFTDSDAQRIAQTSTAFFKKDSGWINYKPKAIRLTTQAQEQGAANNDEKIFVIYTRCISINFDDDPTNIRAGIDLPMIVYSFETSNVNVTYADISW